jgi:hypothetical protein
LGGGLMQLVAYGAQDVYLTGNPQITFFKVVYKRHTNFSIESIEQTFSGNAGFNKKVCAHVTRNGDLITKMYLRAEIPEVCVRDGLSESEIQRTQFAWVRRLGHALIESVELEIGGSRIDKQYGNWFNIWYELTHEVGQEEGYAKMIGDVPEMVEISTPDSRGRLKSKYTIYVPMQFWFCRNNGLALPLIALQYHEVRVHFEFRNVSELCIHSSNFNPKSTIDDIENASLLVDYIYLDTEERRRFAQVSHEYLVEQLQTTGEDAVTSNSYKGRLNFNHPSKALFWGVRAGQYRNDKQFLAYEPFDWDKALKTAAENLLIGQYCMDANTSALICDPDQCENRVVEDTVLLVEKDTGKLDCNGEGRTVCKLDLAVVKQYVTLPDGSDLYNKISGNIVCYEDPNKDGALFIHHVNIVRNDLTIEDLSICTERFVVDNRNEWVKKLDIVVWQHDNYGLYINGTGNPVHEAKLQLNGHDRFNKLDGSYFNYVQPYQHFKNTPSDGVNVYSFALKPIEHQPSGTANFSRIDTTELFLLFQRLNSSGRDVFRELLDPETKIEIFTINYNVLRIMSGMGGLAYSN